MFIDVGAFREAGRSSCRRRTERLGNHRNRRAFQALRDGVTAARLRYGSGERGSHFRKS